MPPQRSRRDFLASVATTAAAATLAAGARAASAAPSAAPVPAPDAPFDDSWTRRVAAAKHKAVFDAPEPSDGLALTQAWIYRSGYRAALGAEGRDVVVPVVVFRHAAASLALDDALWAKYGIGALRKIDDPATRKPAERNPWSRPLPGAAPDADLVALLGAGTDPTVEGVLRAGGVVLVCDLALGRVASAIAAKVHGDAAAVHAELRAGVVPGVIVQPSGVYATARAQEVGCVFMRST
jgi:hypothetical protein